MILNRPDKLTHAETLLYEIDMFRYTANQLDVGENLKNWAALECFLLHFRNLIEFFGRNPREDDLSIFKPEKFWPNAEIPTQEILQLRRPHLWDKYETKSDKISRYLHHCTEQRIESKSWDIQMMLRDVCPLIDKFEQLLPLKQRRWNHPPRIIRTLPSASLSTATIKN